MCVSDLDVSVHGGGLRRPDQTLQLCAAVVLGLSCQFFDVDVTSEQVEAPHLVGMDGEDLDAALLIRQTWRTDERLDDLCLHTHQYILSQDIKGRWRKYEIEVKIKARCWSALSVSRSSLAALTLFRGFQVMKIKNYLLLGCSTSSIHQKTIKEQYMHIIDTNNLAVNSTIL